MISVLDPRAQLVNPSDAPPEATDSSGVIVLHFVPHSTVSLYTAEALYLFVSSVFLTHRVVSARRGAAQLPERTNLRKANRIIESSLLLLLPPQILQSSTGERVRISSVVVDAKQTGRLGGTRLSASEKKPEAGEARRF